jgi:hypothetical protein
MTISFQWAIFFYSSLLESFTLVLESSRAHPSAVLRVPFVGALALAK